MKSFLPLHLWESLSPPSQSHRMRPILHEKSFFLCLLYYFFITLSHAQEVTNELEPSVAEFFKTYSTENYYPGNVMRADSVRVFEDVQTVAVYANETFCSQHLNSELVQEIYANLREGLPEAYKDFELTILSKKGYTLEELVPNFLREKAQDESRLWGERDYEGQPWVTNASLPYKVSRGLQNRHLFIWPSHGRYFKAGGWRWQRPQLFCTTEDLFTQSIVYPYLFPMLEKAGAIVCCPRERDIQKSEAIVDNDNPGRQGTYREFQEDGAPWNTPSNAVGFAAPAGLLTDSVMPFTLGSFRTVETTSVKTRLSQAKWTPRIPKTGKYAVYVSYATLPNSIPDAHYTIRHKGGSTEWIVNQQMGGGTWVYLGTYTFDEGETSACVTLTNESEFQGIVTADAVRFGGGVGQTSKGWSGTSGLPRFLEAARYYAQWAGVPDSLFNTEQGCDDYKDDLRVRSNMLNLLSGSSIYRPDSAGRGVPFELSLALHTDAGVRTGPVYGSLAICTTQGDSGQTTYPTGLSRLASHDFGALLLDGLVNDLSQTFSKPWTRRELWDRNYAETRMPDVPSAILEMLSHQNFTDMKYGHDPYFKFVLARSIYKSILRYIYFQHGIKKYVVAPLPVKAFSAVLDEGGRNVQLRWETTPDPLEKSAMPSAFVLYTRIGNGDFDNGRLIGNDQKINLPISPGVLYSYKICAVNEGGESFPSEILSVYSGPHGAKRVLVVNGFTRVSGPARVETPDSLGFDLAKDIGVPYLYTTAFSGEQLNFDPTARGKEGVNGLGYSGQELTGKIIAGNTFDFCFEHGQSIAATGEYSFSSVSREAFESKSFDLKHFDVIDFIAGQEADVKQNLLPAKAFTIRTRERLENFLKAGGALLVSGSFIGSDSHSAAEMRFTKDVLKYECAGKAERDSTDFVIGLNLRFDIFQTPNATHYASQHPDILLPTSDKAFTAFAYAGGRSAGIAYKGNDYRVIAMGFPFECIKEESIRHSAMRALLDFLTD